MTVLALVDDVIELNGVTIARLLPGLRLSQRDELIAVFDAVDEDAEYIAHLEAQVEGRRKEFRQVKSTLAALALIALMAGPAHADSTIVPDPTLTPGAVRTTDAGDICSTGTRQLRHWDRQRDDRIMAEDGLPAGAHPDFEIDHLVPLGVGGADAEANLWPEPRRSIEPVYNAEAKGRLEWKVRDLICSGQLDVRDAQRMMAEDWVQAYGRFFPTSNFFLPGAAAMTPR